MDISSVSTAEYIQIDASFRASQNDTFLDADTLIAKQEEKMLNRPNLKEGSPQWDTVMNQLEQQSNLIRKRQENFSLKTDKILYRKAPGYFATPDYAYYIYLYDLFDKGHPPFPGAPTDQPAKVIDIMQQIRSLINEAKEEEQKKAESKAKQKNSRASTRRR